MTDITTEYLSDLDLESLPVGTVINCTKGVERGQGYEQSVKYEIQKAPEQPKEDTKDFKLPNGELT
jgi:hypothetical protein